MCFGQVNWHFSVVKYYNADDKLLMQVFATNKKHHTERHARCDVRQRLSLIGRGRERKRGREGESISFLFLFILFWLIPLFDGHCFYGYFISFYPEIELAKCVCQSFGRAALCPNARMNE